MDCSASVCSPFASLRSHGPAGSLETASPTRCWQSGPPALSDGTGGTSFVRHGKPFFPLLAFCIVPM